ncbi:peroxide stress protein YaaA [Aureispira sp. CCB-QB1]|uniref:peroxide stress protein YaaA n=1 Tax=Aureispira sp. CCB-QB1 TaxID=1313421 RepID=UPI0006964AD5|nr:peroxide stress protein YaaA [Aureispira sp. CCB-QB1]
MLLLISPAKTLDFDATNIEKHTQPQLLEQSQTLVDKLKKLNSKKVQDLMGVSEKIADLNVTRYQDFSLPFDRSNAKQAILAFKGDVYQGLSVEEFNEADLDFAQEHIGILSGLYGFLRPLDLMQAYRLEMGTKLKIRRKNNLYEFWGDRITQQINASGAKDIINLASNEYFKSVKKEALEGNLWTVDFKENKNGKYKVVAFYAKKARGMMCNYVVKNRLEKPEEMKGFDMEDYQFNEALSSERHYVFTR